MNRDESLTIDDALAAECRLDFFKATGNGGQKRNKTSSAVRITHLPTGIQVTDCSERSQHRNRLNALEKLKLEIALTVRQPYAPPPENAPKPVVMAHIFDLLAECGLDLPQAAEKLGVSNSKLLKTLARNPRWLTRLNELRVKAGLSVLHA
ncbi:MAG: peptide chain release factor-like protein [Burkholderiaceae bacterium]|nr:peptide chain release factor-like protein [Victivallaceae bacterium]MEA5098002.1 peptide chain release factor-like protein [Burkholderiaceae bacterium]